jgi:spore coat protein U-like protein
MVKNHWALLTLYMLLCMAASGAAVCTVSATGVAFGSYNPLPGREADTAGTIAVTCMGTIGDSVSYQITISPGRGSYQSRQMTSANRALHYNLFIDPARSQVWGDGRAGTGMVADSFRLTAPSVTKTYVVYSRILGSQKQLMARTYLDDLTVTLLY